MKVSDQIAHYLRENGVHCVFEVVGGMITQLIDSLHAARVPTVSMHHEQAAAFAADAVGRMTRVPGIAMATSGPGATNLLTGIGSCYFDSSPAVFITGQVNSYERNVKRGVRQLGFQETDIAAMAKPVTKASFSIRSAEEVMPALQKAFALAMNGRPGPVLLDIPMDFQRADLPKSSETPLERTAANALDLSFLQKALEASRRPLILAGGGVRAAGGADLFRKFAERTGIPVVHSLLGLDLLPSSHSLSIGMIGSYGNRWANLAIGKSDFILVIGSRLDVRQTGADTASWKGDRTVIHVDCVQEEIGNRIPGCVPIVMDARDFLAQALAALASASASYEEWKRDLQALREKWPDTKELTDVKGINPNIFMHVLSSHSTHAAAYVADVGQHQMWAAQSLERAEGQRFLTSGGMGAMGFGLPAAIGVSLIVRPAPIVLIAGDGGFQLNIQELQTVVRNNLPIKMVIVDNQCHGMVRQFQESYMNKRYHSTLWGYSSPDFARVAVSYGIDSRTVKNEEQLSEAMQWLWKDPSAPSLLHVRIDTYLNVYPKLAYGKPITEMEPFARPIGMGEGT